MHHIAGVGSAYEVLAVRYGTRTATKAESYLNFHLYGEPDESFAMDYFFWLVRGPERTVLVDCGFGAEAGRRRGRTTLVDPVSALSALGVEPDDVDQLVVTHAHYDHIGNLHRFPNAEVVIARREYDFWTGPYAQRLQFAHSAEADELAHLSTVRAQGRLRLVEDRLDLAPGIELVVVGGHTPGQLVVQVAADGPGAVVLAADALHFYEELERDRPFFVVADLVEMYRAFDVLREMSEDPGRLVVAGHDADVGTRFRGRVPGLPADLVDLVVDVTGRSAGAAS
ncbi:N-acyl homoserine lactonase family protein [Pseudonocardia abyssalis]|uniref:N-acyl homoserine lactonase family protein n=1 Tax=Pseudonocardia abyssalis TaxID=2792008 RepID=A0ABS6UNA6_9PSEU|nr:N-acyl homoserine lactonase family protein [Pseudonocardia abyssalis]MBW0115026.1 N-acyl homoserine lactonase family protein [Pseudonocardia abyssalis]MBW0133732.1 N-acyl homoserine lactonase family protein [Pseudonocardia abyssalis]